MASFTTSFRRGVVFHSTIPISIIFLLFWNKYLNMGCFTCVMSLLLLTFLAFLDMLSGVNSSAWKVAGWQFVANVFPVWAALYPANVMLCCFYRNYEYTYLVVHLNFRILLSWRRRIWINIRFDWKYFFLNSRFNDHNIYINRIT